MAHEIRRPHPLARAWLYLVALLTLLAGLVIAAGGAWLLSLGGSWYYLVAGIGLLATGIFLFRGSMLAVWIYLVTFVFTLVWALWERGFNGWAQVPRILGPAILFVLVLLTIPVLRRLDLSRSRRAMSGAVAASAMILAVGLAGLAQPLVQPPAVIAQDASAPSESSAPPADVSAEASAEPATPEEPLTPAVAQATLEAGADWPAYGGTYHAQRYSPLAQITKENVGRLEQVWEFKTGRSQARAPPQATP